MTADLRSLSTEWLRAKQEENHAKARRLDLEQQIIAITGTRKTGQMTVNDGDFKVTVKANESWKINWAEFDRIADQIPSHLLPFKTKREPDPAGLRWLQVNRPQIYAALAPAVTHTINKPSVEIAFETRA